MKFKNESGRSMVEMLGVLAIIGVLSIGGIAGYVLSMNRYRANDLIDKANKFASLAYSANATRKARGDSTALTSTTFPFNDAGLGTLNTNKTDGWIELSTSTTTLAFPADNKSVNVSVTFTSKDVCETAATILGKNASSSCTGSGKKTMIINFPQS